MSTAEAVEAYRARRADRNRNSYGYRHGRGGGNGNGLLDGDLDPVEAALLRQAQAEEDAKIVAAAEVEAVRQAERYEANRADAAEQLPLAVAQYTEHRRQVEDALSVLERAVVGLPEARRVYEGAWSRAEKFDLDLPIRLAPLAVAETVRYVTIQVAQG